MSSHPRSALAERLALITGIAALVVTSVIFNRFTPVPFARLCRLLLARIDGTPMLGPYGSSVDSVITHPDVHISVAGEPSARLSVYSPSATTTADCPVVLLIHGGGWVGGSAAQIAYFGKLWASEGFVVANLDYTLAPDAQYPTPVRQAAAALEYLQENALAYGGDAGGLFVSGNSAGAQIASQIAALVTDAQFQRESGISIRVPATSLRGAILFAGPYDFDTVAECRFPGFRMFMWNYVGQRDYENYARIDELSTTKHITGLFPPTYLTAGNGDPLEPQSFTLDAMLREHGVPMMTRYWTGHGEKLPHDYSFDLRRPEARTAYGDTVAFIREHARK